MRQRKFLLPFPFKNIAAMKYEDINIKLLARVGLLVCDLYIKIMI